MLEYLMSPQSAYEPLPLTEVQRYGVLNTVMQSKYTTESSLISTWDCHPCWIWYDGILFDAGIDEEVTRHLDELK